MSVRGCYQGVISFKAAEIRLRQNGKDLSYLTRESDTKKGKFILSWLSNKGIAKHTTVPNPLAQGASSKGCPNTHERAADQN